MRVAGTIFVTIWDARSGAICAMTSSSSFRRLLGWSVRGGPQGLLYHHLPRPVRSIQIFLGLLWTGGGRSGLGCGRVGGPSL